MHLQSRKRRGFTQALAVLLFAAGGIPSLGAELTIEDIIENVRRNEALYDDLDVSLHYEYQTVDHDPVVVSGAAAEITAVEAADHYVTQSGMFRLDRKATATIGGKGESLDRIRAFDGATTRLYDQNQVGNIITGRADDENAVRPHTLFITNVIHAPLSVYLAGHKAMGAHPLGGKKWRDRLTVEASYEGTSERQGLKCHRVWITTSVRGGAPYDRWELWLAEDRNYLPVEMASWTFMYSRDIPFTEGRANDFREVGPGVWFPFDIEVVAYEPGVLQRNGEQAMMWRRRYAITSATLDPQYATNFFRDVVFPNGTAVYEVENRQIRRSYRMGAPGNPMEPQTRAGSHWLLFLNIAVAGVVLLFFFFRWARRSMDKHGGAARVKT